MTAVGVFEEWQADMHTLFGGENHPCPDETRAWIDMEAALGPNMFRSVLEWSKTVPVEEIAGFHRVTRAFWGGGVILSHPVVMAVGKALERKVSRAIGQPAYLSQALNVVVPRGVGAARHRDTAYCRYFVSWPLAFDCHEPWLFHLERQGEDGQVEVDRFDNSDPRRALVFSGHDVHHWRDPYPGKRMVFFFMRYSTASQVRGYTREQVNDAAALGLEELAGRAVNPGSVIDATPEYQGHRSTSPEEEMIVLPALFSPEDCRGLMHHGDTDDWVSRRLYTAIKDTGPKLRTGCGLAGHEHQMDIALSRGNASTWRRDIDDNPRHRTRLVVCLDPDGFQELSFRGQDRIRLELGDAMIWRSDREYRWPRSSPHLTAVYGLPEGFLERWHKGVSQ